MVCPYCSHRNVDSRDHVFADFLGGKAWVGACKHCNNTFGHTIEAAALRHLQNLMFFFRRCGMQPSKPMIWKGIAIGDSGQRYDIDQDLQATPSKPTIERDARGRITVARGSCRHAHQIGKSLEREGRSFRVVPAEPITIDLRQLRIVYPMDDDIKRLCIKMSIAAPLAIGISIPLDSRSRRYLLEATVVNVCPVRIAIDEYVQLDRQRPSVGHLIYTRASSLEHRVYAIVQFFSAIQFYCELTSDYEGPDWAVLATHNPINHEESFKLIPPLDYPLPERYIAGNFQNRYLERFERLRLELVGLYGDQAPLSFHPNA